MIRIDRRRAPDVAAVAAPIVLVAIIRLLSPSGAPAPALAQEPPPTVNPARFADEANPNAITAARRARDLLADALGPSPFIGSSTVVGEGSPDPFGIDNSEPMTEYDAVGFSLTSVVATSSGAVIVLNGRLYRLNDSPAPDWTVTRIDPTQRTATLTHASGRVISLNLAPPLRPRR